VILYEHPFNEKIRTYLRLEGMFERIHALAARESVYDHHFALTTLFEIMDVAGRADLKTEVLKDLDKQKNTLISFRGNSAIDESALSSVIADLDQAFIRLSQTPGRIGSALGEIDWLMSLRSRASIPGGTCSFDLPAYFRWQHESTQQRQADMQAWLEAVEPINVAVKHLMRLVRDSGASQKMIAPAGQFNQYVPQGKPYQLVRIQLSASLALVPETSVNRLLVTTRFVNFSVHERAKQTTSDVLFELTLCT
jgi:cell division protein ZapD